MVRGYITWIAAVLGGAATMVGIEAAFRTVEHAQIVPLAQAAGFVVAWLIAWPYARKYFQPTTGFTRYVLTGFAPSFLIAALRIAFRTG